MARKFLEYKESEDPTLHLETPSYCDESGWPRQPFREGCFFFYGTLMDPGTLARVLQLSEPPQMRPARVIGYQVKHWGNYPVLVDGKPFQPVDGLACEIVLPEHWDRLVAFATDVTDQYDLSPILIDFLDTGEEEWKVLLSVDGRY